MTQNEFNKLNASEILAFLRRYPGKDDAEKIALALLGDDARYWWNQRAKDPIKGIVDTQTGKYKTPFTANGVKYHIRSVREGLGFTRYKLLKQMLSVVGFNATFAEQMQAFDRLVKAANSLVSKEPKLDELFKEIENLRQAVNKTDRTWDYSFYAATLFIVREGEDLNDWNESMANEKIADWQAEGLHEHDFFFLVMFTASQLTEWWNDLPKQIDKAVRDSL
jgi:hypothetical protein